MKHLKNPFIDLSKLVEAYELKQKLLRMSPMERLKFRLVRLGAKLAFRKE